MLLSLSVQINQGSHVRCDARLMEGDNPVRERDRSDTPCLLWPLDDAKLY